MGLWKSGDKQKNDKKEIEKMLYQPELFYIPKIIRTNLSVDIILTYWLATLKW